MAAPSEHHRLAALERLMASIRRHIDEGKNVPCVDQRRAHLWLSETREDQEAAAFGCSTCPALATCHRYVSEFPEPAGVWAGKVRRNHPRVTS